MAANPQSAEYDQQLQAQRFWQGISKLPEPAGRSFLDAGHALSSYLGEPPVPRRLKFDTSPAPANMPWWEKMFFYIGQGSYNQAVAQQVAGEQMVESAKWLGAALQGDFNRSPTTGQVIVGGVISMIPVVDQACDVRDIIANCITLSDEKERDNNENWIALGLTCFGFVPEIGSAVKTVAKTALKDSMKLLDLLKVMEHLEANFAKLGVRIPWGRAPIDWLKKYDWEAAARVAAEAAKKAFKKAQELAQSALRYAVGAIKRQLEKLTKTLAAISARIGEAISNAAKAIKEKIQQLLKGEKKEAGNFGGAPGGPNKHGQRDRTPVEVVRARRKTAEDFYKKQGFDADQARSHMKGIDFDKPVEVVQLKNGTVVEQWQAPGAAQGSYYSPVGSSPSSLGISPQAVSRQTGELVDRVPARFTLQDDIEALSSTASKVTDTWSIPGKAVEAEGGGIQLFSAAKDYFKGAK